MSPATSQFVAIFAIIVGGAFAALQSPTNALLAAAFRSPVTAAFLSFLGGTLTLAIATAALRASPDWAAVKALPWHAWLGGLYGAWFVVAAAYAAPRIGVASLAAFFLAGQVAMSLAIDHFGWLGLPPRPVTLTKVAGVALVFVGALLVRRG